MIEQEVHLKNFIKNKEQAEAVKTFLLSSLQPENWLTEVPLSLDDAEYGQRVKSSVKAKIALESAFEDMERLLEPTPNKLTINEAR